VNRKICKKVNNRAKQLNKQLKQDIFGTRFWIKEVQKSYKDNIHYFLYELRDREQPERNEIIGWFSEFELLTFCNLWLKMNDFIITSDFWQKQKELSK
jgi:hypothetical protein